MTNHSTEYHIETMTMLLLWYNYQRQQQQLDTFEIYFFFKKSVFVTHDHCFVVLRFWFSPCSPFRSFVSFSCKSVYIRLYEGQFRKCIHRNCIAVHFCYCWHFLRKIAKKKNRNDFWVRKKETVIKMLNIRCIWNCAVVVRILFSLIVCDTTVLVYICLCA